MANADKIKDGDKSYQKISFDDKASITAAIRNKQSFELGEIRGRVTMARKWLRAEINNQGMTSLTYTTNRWWLVGISTLFAAPVAGIVAAKFAAENIRSPDYAIRRGLVTDFIEVIYQKED